MPTTAIPERWSVIEWNASPWFDNRIEEAVCVLNGWPLPNANSRACDTWVRNTEAEAVAQATLMAERRPGKYYVVVRIYGYAHVNA